MKKVTNIPENDPSTKKGYNEKNPGQPHGAFPPASDEHTPKKDEPKSNTADKKKKEDQQ